MAWLMTEAELDVKIHSLWDQYFRSGNFLHVVQGAGYWCIGVTYRSGEWLLFEFDDDNPGTDHSVAIAAWERGEPLPERYYALTENDGLNVLRNGVAKYGQDWLDDVDLNSIDEALQGTLFGELRYG